MIVTYTPEAGPAHVWEFRPEKLMSPEAEAIERHTGWTYTEFGEKFMAGSALATHALLWVLLKREAPGIKYADVTFAMGSVQISFDEHETGAVERLLENPKATLTDEQRSSLEALVHQAKARDDGPKDTPAA